MSITLQGQLELEHILLTAWKTVVEKKYSCNDLFLFFIFRNIIIIWNTNGITEYRHHLNPYKTLTLSKAVETAADFTGNSSAFGSSNFVEKQLFK